MGNTYKITAVERSQQWTGQFGPMVSYYLTLDDGHGGTTSNIQLRQKPETPPPFPNQTLTGQIAADNQGNPLFRKEQPAHLTLLPGGGGMPPERQRAIQRQHSQDMALRCVDLAYRLGVMATPADTADLFTKIAAAADWFDKDVNKVSG